MLPAKGWLSGRKSGALSHQRASGPRKGDLCGRYVHLGFSLKLQAFRYRQYDAAVRGPDHSATVALSAMPTAVAVPMGNRPAINIFISFPKVFQTIQPPHALMLQAALNGQLGRAGFMPIRLLLVFQTVSMQRDPYRDDCSHRVHVLGAGHAPY